jgi:dihydroorotate dehydrogenase (fumarate)
MTDLSTTYMGLALPNPVVVSSSGLTATLKGVRKCAEAGAGAIVLKSLFEEQIAAETGALSRYAEYTGHGEAADYLQEYGMDLGPRDYLKLVEEAKRAVDIPIIPSLNCVSEKRWGAYARQLEGAGADAIELNVSFMPTHAREDGASVEDLYYRILHEVKSRVDIPVAMKLGPWFSSFASLADRLTRDLAEAPPFTVGWFGPSTTPGKIVWEGADALVLFNRFFRLDIDVDKMYLAPGNPYSTPAEIHTGLRWISLLSGHVDCDLAANTGVHDGRDVVKQLLAGAAVVQICSTLYLNGLGQIRRMLEQLQFWMQAQGFAALADFRGRLSQARSDHPEDYERLQYIKLFGGKS